MTGAVIVAVGLSSRMNAFKPLLPPGDSTIIETLIRTFRTAGVEGITVVTGFHPDLLQSRLDAWHVDYCHNPDFAVTGRFHSAKLGLARRRLLADRIFFTPGDVPLVAPATLRLLMQATAESDAPVIIPVHGSRKGHPALIAIRVIPGLLEYQGDQGVRGAFSTIRDGILFLLVDDPAIPLDAGCPEDYRRLQDYLRLRVPQNRGIPRDPGLGHELGPLSGLV